jgi:uncharacterized protein (DUF1501 family)
MKPRRLLTPSQSARRRLLQAGAASLFAWSFAPRAGAAQGLEHQRLLVLVLRGGLDGLAAVPAVGDPAYGALRHRPARPGDPPLIPLDGTFALNGNLQRLGAMYANREALIVHATATPYRDRSHFEAQDLLESGAAELNALTDSGWLNRVLAKLPRGERIKPPRALALAPTVPLIMRGPAAVDTWQPQSFPMADDDTIQRLAELYRATDVRLAEALERGAQQDKLTGAGQMKEGFVAGHPYLLETVRAAAQLMTRADGPRVGTMSLAGWDTHHSQGFLQGTVARQLGALDLAIGNLRDGFGSAWQHTAVLIVTEFGRTVRYNGSGGTDHGTATVAFLVGGGVRGGRVVADWPGLAEPQLHQGRDLRPTIDIRAVLKGVLAEHLGVPPATLATEVFPASGDVTPLSGLCRRV